MKVLDAAAVTNRIVSTAARTSRKTRAAPWTGLVAGRTADGPVVKSGTPNAGIIHHEYGSFQNLSAHRTRGHPNMNDDDYKLMEKSVRRMRFDLRQKMLRLGYAENSMDGRYLSGQIRGVERVLELLCPNPHDETKDAN